MHLETLSPIPYQIPIIQHAHDLMRPQDSQNIWHYPLSRAPLLKPKANNDHHDVLRGRELLTTRYYKVDRFHFAATT